MSYVRGIPDYDHPFGLLKFDRSIRKETESDANKKPEDNFQAFQGEGFSLKKSRK